MQKISFDLDVYPYQTDFMGHVNNSVYIHWMEIGRTKLLEAVGMPLHVLLKQGFGPVLTHTSITYKGDLEKLLEPQNAEPETPESSSSILNNLTLFSIVLN